MHLWISRSSVPSIQKWDKTCSSAEWGDDFGHGESPVRSFLSQAAHNGIPRLTPHTYLHPRPSQRYVLWAGRSQVRNNILVKSVLVERLSKIWVTMSCRPSQLKNCLGMKRCCLFCQIKSSYKTLSKQCLTKDFIHKDRKNFIHLLLKQSKDKKIS